MMWDVILVVAGWAGLLIGGYAIGHALSLEPAKARVLAAGIACVGLGIGLLT